jgi:hypothetical protein
LVESDDSAYLYKVEEERVGVPVKGGLYEVSNHFFVVLYQVVRLIAISRAGRLFVFD